MTDYYQLSLDSIDNVQQAVRDNELKLHAYQCQYIAIKLLETQEYLKHRSGKLKSVHDNRGTALLHLYSVVKRAETLVCMCCCLNLSSLQALETAITHAEIKADIVDILLHLRWWMSMLDVAIAAVSQGIVLELLTSADKEFEKLREDLYSGKDVLEVAARKDMDNLLKVLHQVQDNQARRIRNVQNDKEYILSSHLQSRLKGDKGEPSEEVTNVLNRYDISRFLGQGAFGTVLEVTWLERQCALKVLRERDEKAKEATHLRVHQHPHVVQLLRYWEGPSSRYPGDHRVHSHILMELLQKDLGKEIEENNKKTASMPFSLPLAIDVMLQVATAMWHLHHDNLIHRDLKPSNILVRSVSDEVPELFKQGYLHVKLGDFGAAKADQLSTIASKLSKHVGSAVYAAPEVWFQEDFKGLAFPKKADVWSFAMICWEILSGETPFKGVKRENMHENMLKYNLRPILPDGCPDYLRFCITSCWEGLPEDRPNFSDIWRMLRHAKVLSLGIAQLGSSDDRFSYETRSREVKRLMEGLAVKQVEGRPPPVKYVGPGGSFHLRKLFQAILLGVHSVVKFMSRGEAGTKKRPKEEQLNEGTNAKKLGLRGPYSESITIPVTPLPSEPSPISIRSLTGLSPSSQSPPPVDKSPLQSRPSRKRSHTGPMQQLKTDHLVNQVWPIEVAESSNTNLDIIFFEGNVGTEKGLSCKQTWEQRGNPHVCWPRDWLPEDLGNNIRVLLLSYCISESKFEGLVNELLQYLVFWGEYNRGGTWERPIVLVGHSLGGIVMKNLVVKLDQIANSNPTLALTSDRSNTAKAFLENLRGCFFYAVPHGGMVTSPARLAGVFGGLDYSEGLFRDMVLRSPLLSDLSGEFLTANNRNVELNVKLVSFIESKHTNGDYIVPESSIETFAGEKCKLDETQHSDVCKPSSKQHDSYKQLLTFLQLLRERQEACVESTEMVGLVTICN